MWDCSPSPLLPKRLEAFYMLGDVWFRGGRCVGRYSCDLQIGSPFAYMHEGDTFLFPARDFVRTEVGSSLSVTGGGRRIAQAARYLP